VVDIVADSDEDVVAVGGGGGGGGRERSVVGEAYIPGRGA
jgi:hypothetical protein